MLPQQHREQPLLPRGRVESANWSDYHGVLRFVMAQMQSDHDWGLFRGFHSSRASDGRMVAGKRFVSGLRVWYPVAVQHWHQGVQHMAVCWLWGLHENDRCLVQTRAKIHWTIQLSFTDKVWHRRRKLTQLEPIALLGWAVLSCILAHYYPGSSLHSPWFWAEKMTAPASTPLLFQLCWAFDLFDCLLLTEKRSNSLNYSNPQWRTPNR